MPEVGREGLGREDVAVYDAPAPPVGLPLDASREVYDRESRRGVRLLLEGTISQRRGGNSPESLSIIESMAGSFRAWRLFGCASLIPSAGGATLAKSR